MAWTHRAKQVLDHTTQGFTPTYWKDSRTITRRHQLEYLLGVRARDHGQGDIVGPLGGSLSDKRLWEGVAAVVVLRGAVE